MSPVVTSFSLMTPGGNGRRSYPLWLRPSAQTRHTAQCKCSFGELRHCYEPVEQAGLKTNFRKAHAKIEGGLKGYHIKSRSIINQPGGEKVSNPCESRNELHQVNLSEPVLGRRAPTVQV